MQNKALILYTSATGNTEKVACQFEQTLLAYGWDCDRIALQAPSELQARQLYLDHYDLVLLGTPVISGAPSPLVSQNIALVDAEPPRLYSNQMIFPGSLFRPEQSPLGIVFATYSGETYGPCEAQPALDLASMYLQYLFIDVIGKFACPGRKESKNTIDLLAAELNIHPSETARMIGIYERDPQSPALSGLSEDAMALLHQAIVDKQHGSLVPVPAEFPEDVWHRDLSTRPNARDLKKAQFFLEEILEDYFTPEGLPRRAGSVYQCIG